MRASFLPYARPHVTDDDIEAVTAVLRSRWLTTGPTVEAFEEEFAAKVGANHAVTFSSGTAALHGAMRVAGVGSGAEVVTTPFTFCATANAVLYQGGATAVKWLIDSHSDEAFWDRYYTAIPELGWERAFEQAFGMTIDSFYGALRDHLGL